MPGCRYLSKIRYLPGNITLKCLIQMVLLAGGVQGLMYNRIQSQLLMAQLQPAIVPCISGMRMMKAVKS